MDLCLITDLHEYHCDNEHEKEKTIISSIASLLEYNGACHITTILTAHVPLVKVTVVMTT